ncbi:hypothetical protein L9F63_019267, partial [Diploptera punctata]
SENGRDFGDVTSYSGRLEHCREVTLRSQNSSIVHVGHKCWWLYVVAELISPRPSTASCSTLLQKSRKSYYRHSTRNTMLWIWLLSWKSLPSWKELSSRRKPL